MTWEEIYGRARQIYKEEKGERFFSFSLLWACLCEKRGADPSLRFSPDSPPESDADRLLSDARRLCAGFPLQYYLGYWEFRGETYLCREKVLIPREDTALLCSLSEQYLPKNGVIADFCCGSGIVGISVLLNRPDCRGISLDLSPDALALTSDNARRLGVEDRLEIRPCDLFSDAAEALLAGGGIDVFACNPPYIPTDVIATLEENVRREPLLALDGGADGLRFYRRILALRQAFPSVIFLCEIGYDQQPALQNLCSQLGIDVEYFEGRCMKI